MEIRALLPSEQGEALELALAVFAEYEGPIYPPEGTASFQKSLSDPDYLGMLHRFYGAWEDGKLVGMLATREEGRHIALFFVEGRCHRRGIGKRLFTLAAADCPGPEMSVASSPYAVGIYHRLGFTDTDCEQEKNGIRYTPMVWHR